MIEVKNLRDSHKFYKQQSEDNTVPVGIYLDIVHGLMKFTMQKVFDGYDVKLGPGDSLGVIYIRGKKIKPYIDKDGNVKGIAPDWGATKKLWKENPEAKEKKNIVYCTNEHSNGVQYNLLWRTKETRLHNKTYYSLTFSRANRRTVPALIRSGKEYLVTSIPKKYKTIKNGSK